MSVTLFSLESMPQCVVCVECPPLPHVNEAYTSQVEEVGNEQLQKSLQGVCIIVCVLSITGCHKSPLMFAVCATTCANVSEFNPLNSLHWS